MNSIVRLYVLLRVAEKPFGKMGKGSFFMKNMAG